MSPIPKSPFNRLFVEKTFDNHLDSLRNNLETPSSQIWNPGRTVLSGVGVSVLIPFQVLQVRPETVYVFLRK